MTDLGSGLGSGSSNATGASDSECYSPYDSHDYTIVAAISSTMGAISFLACLFMIGIIILYKKYLFFTQRLILYLSIAAALVSFTTVLHIAERNGPNWLCVGVAYVDHTVSWAVLIAITCITVNLTLLVLFHRNTERLEKVYVIFIFVLPLTFSWIPFINEAYGKAGAWCWIRSEDDNCNSFTYGAILQLILWYIPLYILFIILTIVYVIILVKLRRDRNQWTGQYDPTANKMQQVMQREIRPLLWFPLIYLVLYVIPLINRIQGAASDDPVLALWILTAIFFPSQGGFIALAFTLDPETFKRLKWPEFKATVKQMWSKDVREYPISRVHGDSLSTKSRKKESNTLVRNEVAINELEEDRLRKVPIESIDP